MKKTGYIAFILISTIMFLCCMWFSQKQSKLFEMDLQDIEGKREVLEPVSYNISYRIGQHVIDIQASGSTFQYENKSSKYAEDDHVYKSEKELRGEKGYEVDPEKSYLHNEEWKSMYQSCDIKETDIASSLISYKLYLGSLDYDDVVVKTNIYDHSNEEYQLKRYDVNCEVTDNIVNRYRVEKEKKQELHRGLYFMDNQNEDVGRGVYEDIDTVYFMPPMDLYASGQNEIYKIKPSENKEASISVLKKLPKNRLYETMEVSDDQLYVFSHDDEGLYITIYDTNGTLIKEMKIDYQYQKGDALTNMYVRNHSVIWQRGTTYQVIDMDTMKLMDAVEVEQEVYDLTYANHTLYFLTKGSEEESWYIQAYQNKNRVYQGEIKVPYKFGNTESEIRSYGEFLD